MTVWQIRLVTKEVVVVAVVVRPNCCRMLRWKLWAVVVVVVAPNR